MAADPTGIPTPPIYTNPILAGSEAMFITPEAMMAYCQTQITGLDKQVSEYFDKQQKNAAAQKALGDVQNAFPAADGKGDVKLTAAQKAELADKLDKLKEAYENAGLATGPIDDLKHKIVDGHDPIADANGNPTDGNLLNESEMTGINNTIKNFQSDLGTSSQLDLISMQELMSKRQSAIQLTTNLMSTFNDSAKSVIGNIK